MTQTTAPLQIPPVLNLQVNGPAYELIMASIAKNPFEVVHALMDELKQQAQQQIIAFNVPRMPPSGNDSNIQVDSIAGVKAAVKRAARGRPLPVKKKPLKITSKML